MEGLLSELWPLTASTLRLATPLLLAALGGLFAERAGVVDIGLEGKMLGAGFAAAAAAAVSGSAWVGLGAGIAFSVALAMLHGVTVITYRGDQVVSGMAINIVVAGLAPSLANAWFQLAGQTPLLEGAARFAALRLPGAEALAGVPLIGPFYAEVVSGHSLMTYLGFALVPVSAWLLYRTRFGLALRAVGEAPEAVDAAGLSVPRLRYQALVLTGILCGIAGTAMAIALSAGFIRDMSAGKGYLALAAVILGRWRPVPTMLACLLFAFTDAAQGVLQGTHLPGVGVIPVPFIMMLPYVITVVVLAGFVGRIQAPRASGVPYVKEG